MRVVNHDESARRFFIDEEGQRAVLDYTLSERVMAITHTGVPQPIAGRGIAAQLMRAALRTAQERGWEVVPRCSYARAYLARHPPILADQVAESGAQHQSDLLDEALEESFPASDPPAVGSVS